MKILIYLSCLLIPTLALADGATPTPNPCAVNLSGYLEGSYNYLVNNNKFISGEYDRVYDIRENGFTFHQAALTIAQQPPEGFGGVFNFILGRDAYDTAPFGEDPNIGLGEIGLAILQLFGQYTKGPLTLMAGQYLSLIGVEAVDPTSNANFSCGLLCSDEPNTHLGVRGIYAYNNKVKLTFGLNNGWDNIRDFTRGPTVEWGVAYTPCAKLALSAQGYSGEERVITHTASGPKGWRNIINLIATYQVNDHLTLVSNYDYGNQAHARIVAGDVDVAVWQGLAGYINYKFNDKWHVSLRGEWFDDQDGYHTGVHQTLEEATFTVSYVPCKNLELRAEIRHDFSNVDAFFDHDGVEKTNYQQSYALQGIYKFSNG